MDGDTVKTGLFYSLYHLVSYHSSNHAHPK